MVKHRAAASGEIQMLYKKNRNYFRTVQLFKSHSESHLWQQTAATPIDQCFEQKKIRKPYLYRLAICHLRCVLKKVEEASRALAFLHERWTLVFLMSRSACRQKDGSTASCANSWVELFCLHFLNFDSSCRPQTASKNFQNPTTMAGERETQGTFPSFVINQIIAFFQLKCYQYSNLHPLFPSLLFQTPRQANTNETFRNEDERCGKPQGEHGKTVQLFCLILICYWNLASRHGTDKM